MPKSPGPNSLQQPASTPDSTLQSPVHQISTTRKPSKMLQHDGDLADLEMSGTCFVDIKCRGLFPVRVDSVQVPSRGDHHDDQDTEQQRHADSEDLDTAIRKRLSSLSLELNLYHFYRCSCYLNWPVAPVSLQAALTSEASPS